MTSQHSDPPPQKRGSTKRSDSLSLQALLGPFFVTKTPFYCRYSDRMWFSPLDSQPLLPGRAVRQDGPPEIGPETVGMDKAHALRFRRLKPWACAAAVLKNTDIFSMTLPTVSYLDSERDLSVLFAVAHFKLCGVERTPCTVGKARLQVNVQ